MKIGEALVQASEILQDGGVSEFRSEAALLLSLAISRDKIYLITHPEYALTGEEYARFEGFIHRRANREPFQYISGRQEFFGLEFDVTPDVLIPRPETELLAERGIEILGRKSGPTAFCEIGVGSGCISVSILNSVVSSVGLGLDMSDKAIQVAGRNAQKHGVGDRLKLNLSDVYDVLAGQKFDLIVSNPPYVPSDDMARLQAEVRDFEPHEALTGGGDGLSIIRRIVTGAPKFLSPGGHLLMEIGFGQSERVLEMFDRQVWAQAVTFPDLQGIPRIVDAKTRN